MDQPTDLIPLIDAFWGAPGAGPPARVLANPRLGLDTRALERWAAEREHLRSHLLLGTSGSTGAAKWVALSRSALLASAAAVNAHLRAGPADTWLLALPLFHAGGLGILARARLAGSRVARMDGSGWEPAAFAREAHETGATLSALTPTQVSDLVTRELGAPGSLRAIVVGGGAFPVALSRAARALGWPVLASYGLTEAASQVATSALDDPPDTGPLPILPHWETRLTEAGLLALRGPALASGYVVSGPDADWQWRPLADAGGWFTTRDRVRLIPESNRLEPLDRADRCVKVSGELVSLDALQQLWETLAEPPSPPPTSSASPQGWIAARPDARLGHVVILVTEARSPAPAQSAADATDATNLTARMAAFQARVAPFERIRHHCEIPALPRSPLGKILWRELGLI